MSDSSYYKSILFISALDFKEKSIQVIRKTPEAFVKADWDVHYIVARDNSKHGTYYYENVINPEGIHVYRFEMPLKKLRNNINNHLLLTIITKIAGYLTILKLTKKAKSIIKKENIRIIYGYEIHGVLATMLLRLSGKLKNIKTVSRFQGTWLTSYYKNKQYIKLLLNLDAIIATKIKTDLCIMTNDGTQGNYLYRKKRDINFKFWVNGTDEQNISNDKLSAYLNTYKKNNEIIIISICRLEPWKRVDRVMKVLSKLVNEYHLYNLKYLVIGEGPEKTQLINLVKSQNIEEYVIFRNSVHHDEVKYYLKIADIFISTYDLSNVGNPLLEAIRDNKIIFTLNNGDTSLWIQHKINGFIYDIDSDLYQNMADDIYKLINDPKLQKCIKNNIKHTEEKKLWNWNERMQAEIEEVTNLL